MPGFSGFSLPPDTTLPVQQNSFIGDLSKQIFSPSSSSNGMNSLLTMMRFMQARQNAAILAQNRALDQQIKQARLQNELFKQKYGRTAKEQQANILREKQEDAAAALANNPDFIDMYRGSFDASTVRRDKIFKDLRTKFIEPITKTGPYAGADPYALEEALLGPEKRKLESDKDAIKEVSWFSRTGDRLRQGYNTAMGYVSNLFSDKSPDQIAKEVQEANRAITQANPALVEDERRAVEGEGWYDRGDWLSHATGETPTLAAYGAPTLIGGKLGSVIGSAFGPAGTAAGGLAGAGIGRLVGSIAGLLASSAYGGSQGSVDYSTSILNSGMSAADQQAALNNESARNIAKGVGAGIGLIPGGGRLAFRGAQSLAARSGIGELGRRVAAAGSKEGREAVLREARNKALFEEAQRGWASRAARGASTSALEFGAMGAAGTYGANTAYNTAVPEQYRVDPSSGMGDAALSSAFTGALLGAGHGTASKIVSSKLTSRDAAVRARYTPEGRERESIDAIAKDYQAAPDKADPTPFISRLYDSYHDDPGAFDRLAKAAGLSAEEREGWRVLYNLASNPEEMRARYERLQKAEQERKTKGKASSKQDQKDLENARQNIQNADAKQNALVAAALAEQQAADKAVQEADAAHQNAKQAYDDIAQQVKDMIQAEHDIADKLSKAANDSEKETFTKALDIAKQTRTQLNAKLADALRVWNDAAGKLQTAQDAAKAAAEKVSVTREATANPPSVVETADDVIERLRKSVGTNVAELDKLVSIAKADRNTNAFELIRQAFADDSNTRLANRITNLTAAAEFIQKSPFVEKIYDGIKGLTKTKLSDEDIAKASEAIRSAAYADTTPTADEINAAIAVAKYHKKGKGPVNKIMNELMTKLEEDKKNASAEKSVSSDGQKGSDGSANAGDSTDSKMATPPKDTDTGAPPAGDENAAGSNGTDQSGGTGGTKASDNGENKTDSSTSEESGTGNTDGEQRPPAGDSTGSGEANGSTGSKDGEGERGNGNGERSEGTGGSETLLSPVEQIRDMLLADDVLAGSNRIDFPQQRAELAATRMVLAGDINPVDSMSIAEEARKLYSQFWKEADDGKITEALINAELQLIDNNKWTDDTAKRIGAVLKKKKIIKARADKIIEEVKKEVTETIQSRNAKDANDNAQPTAPKC